MFGMGLSQTQFELLGGGMMAGGLLLSLGAFALFFFGSLRASRPGPAPRLGVFPGLTRPWILALIFILAVAAALRLWGLDARGMSHPELYTPGLDLPEGLSDPPPRHGLAETAGYHFFWEPHPFGYYLLKWAWVKLTGTSLFLIRLPEAILGAASVYLTYRVGKLAFDARTGVVAAALLAVHGMHIYWSQMARMYVPGAFFGLIATWMLLELARRERPSPALETAYVAAIAASALSVEFTWPLLAGHLLWIALRNRDPEHRIPRLAVWPTLALILASPMLAHALIGARGEAALSPTFSFLVDWFSLSFLGRVDEDEVAGWIPAALVAIATIPLFIRGLLVPSAEPPPAAPPPAPRLWPLGLATLGAAVTILGVAAAAPGRKALIALAAIIPIAALAGPLVIGWLGRTLGPRIDRLRSPTALVPLLAIGPPLFVVLVSFGVALISQRTFLQFTPYLVITVAAGLVALWPRKAQFLPALASLAAALVFGFFLHKQNPSGPRDYEGLAKAIEADWKPGDMIFTRKAHWAFSPMFYYLPGDRFVAADFQQVVEQARGARFWLLDFPDAAPTDPEALAALSGHRAVRRIEVTHGAATLYEAPTP